jgi:hypothetical protein
MKTNSINTLSIVILILGLFFIFVLREYLQNNNHINAETEKMKCINETYKTFDDSSRIGLCNDIVTF